MVRFVKVQLKRSETTKMQCEVAAWELPVFLAANGEENCRVLSERFVPRDPPEAGFEYDRLSQRYRAAQAKDGGPSEGQPFVTLVYGPGSMGVERLAAEIRKAQVEMPDPLDGLEIDPLNEGPSFGELVRGAEGPVALDV